jgi:hypothetical protein
MRGRLSSLLLAAAVAACTGWPVTPSPNAGSEAKLDGVSCTGPAFCLAVGSFNGSAGTLADSLEAVSCVSSGHCVAAGYYRNEDTFGRTLIESWSSSRWSIVASPDPGRESQLLGVSCTSVRICKAAGYHGNGSLLSDATLVETGS